MAVRFKVLHPDTNEGRDLQKVLKDLIERGKEDLTEIGLPPEDTSLMRGEILGMRKLLEALMSGPLPD